MQDWMWIVLITLVTMGGSAGLVALGAWGLPILKKEKQGYPMEAEIEAVLIPFAFQGICAAYRVSGWAVEEIGKWMAGADRQAIAASIYDLLPDQIGKFPLHVIKNAVGKERFVEIVQGAFDRFNRDFVQFQNHYTVQFEQWKQDLQAG